MVSGGFVRMRVGSLVLRCLWPDKNEKRRAGQRVARLQIGAEIAVQP